MSWHPEEGDDLRLLTGLVEAASEAPAPAAAPGRRSDAPIDQPRKPVAAKPKAGSRR